jgi:hypothetical protein
MPRWQVVQRSTFGVPEKITSSWRLVGMIWLIFRDGLARSRTGMLRTNDTNPGWIWWSLSCSRLYSAYMSFCVLSASSLVFSRSCRCFAAAAFRASMSSSSSFSFCQRFSRSSSRRFLLAALLEACWVASS